MLEAPLRGRPGHKPEKREGERNEAAIRKLFFSLRNRLINEEDWGEFIFTLFTVSYLVGYICGLVILAI